MALPRPSLALRGIVRPPALNAAASSSRYVSSSPVTPPRSSETALPVPLPGIKFLSMPPLTPLPPPHGIHVATLHLQAHHPYNLDLVAQFAVHAAHSLSIPTSFPAFLPREKSLYTVLKSPFVKKKAQENFERRTHKRAIKVYDADREAVDLWLRYLRQNGLPGVGMKAYIHEWVDFGFGRKEAEGKNEIEMEVEEKRIQDAAEELVKALSEGDGDAGVQKIETKSS
ncbi:37S ribosomal protein S10, mitochondrial [Cryptococcus tetragattii IND107]|uniref:37S ribosomal protein S10, mitochondrial n=1 Tax=Cryptococcus tetragattii IND107 TaxID=1296105 RepID=A0ABR3BP46_9TREE